MCSPIEQKYAPPSRHPKIDLPDICKELNWPRLKALELKWISAHSRDLLTLLDRHKYSLQFINIYEMYIKDSTAWPSVTGYLCHRHSNIILDRPAALYYNPLIINYTLYDEEATCTNTGHANYDHRMMGDYDEDQVSSYSKNEGFDEMKEEERYSSEELDFSEGGDEREWED